MKTSPTFIISGQGTINAHYRGQTYVVLRGHAFYSKALRALRVNDGEAFVRYADLGYSLSEKSGGDITIRDGMIEWRGCVVNNALTARVMRLVEGDYSFRPLMLFLSNLLQNPSSEAINELYLFLEGNNLPITADGYFLAYRRVGKDYMSLHANPDGSRNRNKIGDIVTMPREHCDENRHATCSRGLHFASLSYIPHYGSDSNGDKTVIVKINPKDVVSIPSDYANQKGRCCAYEVVGEHLMGEEADSLTEAPVYQVVPSSDACPMGVKPVGKRHPSKRDPYTGRWVK